MGETPIWVAVSHEPSIECCSVPGNCHAIEGESKGLGKLRCQAVRTVIIERTICKPWIGNLHASEFVDIIAIMQSYCMVLVNSGILRIKYYLAITPR